MDPSCCVWNVIQSALAFVVGWHARTHCKVEVDVDTSPEPMWTRIVRVFTGEQLQLWQGNPLLAVATILHRWRIVVTALELKELW